MVFHYSEGMSWVLLLKTVLGVFPYEQFTFNMNELLAQLIFS